MTNEVDLSGSKRSILLKKLREISENPSYEWQLYLAAKYYASIGLYVLPLVKDGKSLPPKKYNINYGCATTQPTTVDKWFHPNNGKFAGWNIGIATGKEGGVFAIDVDKHGEVDGHDVLKELESEYGVLPYTPIQITPSGGSHYLFMWQENASSSTGKIGKSIDTRGGDSKACKGHIVAFPSIINNKQYLWAEGGEISYIPPWVMEKLGVAWKKPSPGMQRGNEMMDDSDFETEISVEQINRMLEFIDPDMLSYEQWLKIGQAINTQHPDEGLKIWDDWSKKGKRYEPGECNIRWGGFNPMGPVRVGTLFYYAKDGGWVPTEEDKIGGKYDELVERMNQTYAVTVIGNKVRIIAEKDEEHNPVARHFDLLTKDDFKTLTENEFIIGQDNKGNPKRIPISHIWLSHEARRTYKNGIGLFPEGNVEGYFNTWKGFSVDPVKGNCSKFKEMIKNGICNGDEFHYQWLMDWIADLFQDPANPKGACIVMRGEEGTGKGILANTVGELFGSHYVHLIDPNHLTGQFNSHLMDAVVLFADEITWGGYVDRSGKLKGLITEKYLLGERKGIDAIRYRNMIHGFIASNEKWVVPSGPTSRRWFVLDVSQEHLGDTPYYKSIVKELDNGGREAFLYEMLNREIEHDLTRAPETEALHEQRAMSVTTDTVVQWLTHCVEMERMGAIGRNGWPEYVVKHEMYALYEEWCYTRKKKADTQMSFYKRMTSQSINLKEVRPEEVGRKRAYELPKIEDARALVYRLTGIRMED